ncbi:hypothetical protein H4R19_006208, partial [Coemansia spiralis]
ATAPDDDQPDVIGGWPLMLLCAEERPLCPYANECADPPGIDKCLLIPLAPERPDMREPLLWLLWPLIPLCAEEHPLCPDANECTDPTYT